MPIGPTKSPQPSHSSTPQPSSRAARRGPLSLLAFATVAITFAANLVDMPAGRVSPALAIDCQPVNDGCGQDNTKTSAMEVELVTVAGVATPVHKVEPDTSIDFDITAFWEATVGCAGAHSNETAQATVTWNGSSWVLEDVNLTDNIVAINVCLVSSCLSGSTPRSWKFKLTADINDPEGNNGYNLEKVKYETTSIDNGTAINSLFCSTIGAVSPTSQTFTGWDNPNDKWLSSRCNFTCSIVGGSMTIGYN